MCLQYKKFTTFLLTISILTLSESLTTPLNTEKSLLGTLISFKSTTASSTTTTRLSVTSLKPTLGTIANKNFEYNKLGLKSVNVECDLPLLPNESRLWRGNETHELNLPFTVPEDCANTIPSGTTSTILPDDDCPPVLMSWEGSVDIQSGDVLIVRIRDEHLIENARKSGEVLNLVNAGVTIVNKTTGLSDGKRIHRAPPQPAVYQVTRQGHEHCDVTEGVLLDITPLAEDDAKIVTLYDKDLTDGINLLIVVSENWGNECVRLKVTVKSDNCGDEQDCSGKGVCYTNVSMEGYECQCCPGYVGQHCEEQDACSPSQCLNNGICIQGHEGDNYQCLCPYGYSGKKCEKEMDPCVPSPCQNGGTCLNGNRSQHFHCICSKGFIGLLCDAPVVNGSSCATSPCVHGICVDNSTRNGNGFKCFCEPGFAGERCEYEYNECESSPCANGGTCTDQVGNYACACGRGYTGNRCQTKVDLCSPNPCTSHRYCIDRGNSYSCECPRGFTGIDCSLPARAACNNNPCANGGTCWSGIDSFYCSCSPGYTGKLCQDEFILEKVTAESDDLTAVDEDRGDVREMHLPLALYHDRMHNLYIAAATLGAAITIVGVVVTACHCRISRTYSRWRQRVPAPEPPEPRTPLTPHFTTEPPRAPHWLSGSQNHSDMFYTLDLHDTSPLIH